MALKIIFFLAAISAVSACSAQSTRTYSDSELLKNFALAKCIAKTDGSPNLKKDADAAAQGYLEFGNVDVGAYEEAIALADSFFSRTYAAKSGESLNVMKCIDLCHSNDLNNLVRKYTSGK